MSEPEQHTSNQLFQWLRTEYSKINDLHNYGYVYI